MPRAGRSADGGRGLADVAAADLSGLAALPPGGVTVLSDVTNPLLGPVRLRQPCSDRRRAPTAAEVGALDAGLARLAATARRRPRDPRRGGRRRDRATACSPGVRRSFRVPAAVADLIGLPRGAGRGIRRHHRRGLVRRAVRRRARPRARRGACRSRRDRRGARRGTHRAGCRPLGVRRHGIAHRAGRIERGGDGGPGAVARRGRRGRWHEPSTRARDLAGSRGKWREPTGGGQPVADHAPLGAGEERLRPSGRECRQVSTRRARNSARSNRRERGPPCPSRTSPSTRASPSVPSTAGCSAPSSSTSAAACTRASTSRATPPPTRRDSGRT